MYIDIYIHRDLGFSIFCFPQIEKKYIDLDGFASVLDSTKTIEPDSLNSFLFEAEKNIRLDNICRGWCRLEDEPFQFMEHLTIFRLRSFFDEGSSPRNWEDCKQIAERPSKNAS